MALDETVEQQIKELNELSKLPVQVRLGIYANALRGRAEVQSSDQIKFIIEEYNLYKQRKGGYK